MSILSNPVASELTNDLRNRSVLWKCGSTQTGAPCAVIPSQDKESLGTLEHVSILEPMPSFNAKSGYVRKPIAQLLLKTAEHHSHLT